MPRLDVYHSALDTDGDVSVGLCVYEVIQLGLLAPVVRDFISSELDCSLEEATLALLWRSNDWSGGSQ